MRLYDMGALSYPHITALKSMLLDEPTNAAGSISVPKFEAHSNIVTQLHRILMGMDKISQLQAS
jgi:hypothetical protein